MKDQKSVWPAIVLILFVSLVFVSACEKINLNLPLALISKKKAGNEATGFDWPRWRGPDGNGISKEKEWNPNALENKPKILWKTYVGPGYSNVAIEDKRLYTMGSKDGKLVIFCLHAETGKRIWQSSFDLAVNPQSTPTIDDEYVYCISKEGELLCLDARKGKLRWRKNLVEEFHAECPNYFFATSAVVDGNLLVININEYGVVLEKTTGSTMWTSPPTNDKYISQYSTPLFCDINGERCAILFGNYIIHAVELKTGKPLWSFDWDLLPVTECGADPIYYENKVFVSTYGNGCALVDIKGNNPTVIWKNMNMSNDISSSVLVDGYIYGVDGKTDGFNNSLRCLDFATGKLMWEHKMKMATLTAADGKLIILNERGSLSIAKATPSSYQEISSTSIQDQKGLQMWWTSPVLCQGRLYCHSNMGDLICIEISS